jgi:hypothetical protein|tara:strand:- start:1966 stop:2214 length:249 start_codon:yes stop_codon:yes gene_type:complete
MTSKVLDRFDRFVVKNYSGLTRQTYSTKLEHAFQYACDCADYEHGKVLGEKVMADGSRTREQVYTSENYLKIDTRRKNKKNG